jgi:hypothetical protein
MSGLEIFFLDMYTSIQESHDVGLLFSAVGSKPNTIRAFPPRRGLAKLTLFTLRLVVTMHNLFPFL